MIPCEMVGYYKHNLNDSMWNVWKTVKLPNSNYNIDLVVSFKWSSYCSPSLCSTSFCDHTMRHLSHTLGPLVLQPILLLYQKKTINSEQSVMCHSASVWCQFAHITCTYTCTQISFNYKTYDTSFSDLKYNISPRAGEKRPISATQNNQFIF